jgi:hypothetical protein
MSSGWVVHVELRTKDGNKSSQTYYARLQDRIEAIEAVRKHVGAASDAVIEARKPVQSSALDVVNIGIGQVGINGYAPQASALKKQMRSRTNCGIIGNHFRRVFVS